MKYIPNEKQIEELLEGSLSKPGKRLEKRLSAAPWTPRAVSRRRLVNVAVFSALTFALLVAATPQGRAFAQELLGFFTTTSQSSFPATPPIPQLVASVTFIPVETAPTAITSDLDECKSASASSSSYICQLTSAEKALGFEIKVFSKSEVEVIFGSDLPFTSIAVDSWNQSVQLIFDHLWLYEGLGDFPLAKAPWEVVPQNAIETITVDGRPAEYLAGDFIQLAGSQEYTWESKINIQRLRWKDGNRWFEIRSTGSGLEFSLPISKSDLVTLAETLVSYSQGADLLAGEASLELDQRAGFHIQHPSILPKGFQLCYADYGAGYDGPTAFLSYCDNEGTTLVIDQMLVADASPYDFNQRWGQEITVSEIKIGSISGYHFRRVDGVQGIMWETNGIRTEIVFQPSSYLDNGKRIEPAELLSIAESLR